MSIQEENLSNIADAIREVSGTSDKIPANEFADKIRGLPTGGSSVEVDLELNPESNNPIANSVVAKAVQELNTEKVPTTTCINGKELCESVELTAADVGADEQGAADNALIEAKAYADAIKSELTPSMSINDNGIVTIVIPGGPTINAEGIVLI